MSWLLNSTDGLDAGAVAGHQFVLFEELRALMAPAARAPLPATLLPHHNGEVAMPRRWKTLIFLTALLTTTLSFASLLRPSRATGEVGHLPIYPLW
jgi:hypothetical protein